MKTEKELLNEIDDMIEDVKNFRGESKEGEEIPKNYFIAPKGTKTIEKSVRQLKGKEKHTFKVKMQIGKKKYSLRKETWYYGQDHEEVPSVENVMRGDWYITNRTMKNILKNHREFLLVKLTASFDGMIDCQTFNPDAEWKKPTDKYFQRIIDDLSRRGLMRSYFDEEKGVFKSYSCCDDFEFIFEGIDIRFL